MAYAPSAPDIIWAIPSDVLDPGSKLTLMALWSWADRDEDPTACTVSARARDGMTATESVYAKISEQTGCSMRAARRHLTKLRRLGFAVCSGRTVDLDPRPMVRESAKPDVSTDACGEAAAFCGALTQGRRSWL